MVVENAYGQINKDLSQSAAEANKQGVPQKFWVLQNALDAGIIHKEMLVAKQNKVSNKHRKIIEKHCVVGIGSLLLFVILVLRCANKPIKN